MLSPVKIEDDIMVDQPAYLKNLKDYARIPIGDARVKEAILALFDKESDRSAIMLAATAIEDALEICIL